MRRNHDAHAVVEDRRLVAVGRRLALHDRLGLDHLAGDLLRDRDRKRLVAVVFDGRRHAVLEEGAAVAQQFGIKLDLLESLAVHEDEAAVILIKELLVLLLKPHLFDLVFGPEAFVQLPAIAQVLELDLGEGAALARLDMVDLDRGPEAPVMLQHVAGADFIAVDLGHRMRLEYG